MRREARVNGGLVKEPELVGGWGVGGTHLARSLKDFNLAQD